MAAILCGGIGKACSGLVECTGQLCMLPFRLCGFCCEGLSKCCGESCKLVANCCSTSFCFYITVTCVLNLPPIILGLADIPNVAYGCQGSIWLLVFWLLCLVNILASFYMSVAIQRDDTILPHTTQESNTLQQNAQDGISRMTKLFCYDGWMAVYILAFLGFFAWLILGGIGLATGSMDDDESCDDINGKVAIASGFGWAFIFIGGCALMSSICCSLFQRPDPPVGTANINPTSSSKPNSSVYGSTTSAPSAPMDGGNNNSSSKQDAANSMPSTPSAPMEDPPMATAVLVSDDNVVPAKTL